MRFRVATATGVVLLAGGLAGGSPASPIAAQDRPPEIALPAFDSPPLSAPAFREHLATLAHDSMLGRAQGTPGGALAEAYLEAAFTRAGLVAPDAPGDYRQEVPLLRTAVDPSSAGARLSDGNEIAAEQLIVWSSRDASGPVILAGPVILVGHGISAPEHGVDDYAGVDARGSFVAVEPGLSEDAAARLPGGLNAFAGEDDAKSAVAARHGALGVVFLSQPDGGERFRRRRRMANTPAHYVRTWGPPIEPDVTMALAPAASAALRRAAGRTSMTLSFEQRADTIRPANILGVVEGTGAELVVVTSHLDGYGVGPADETGDSIYNGATDNAAGMAGMLELARWLAGRDAPPVRTVVFVATTAEEGGKHGAGFYAAHPVGSIERTILDLNLDGLGWSAPTDGYAAFPSSGTDALDDIDRVLTPLGLSHSPQAWHDGMAFSFDTAEFLARGVVGLTLWQGGAVRDAFRDRPRATTGQIHSPSDEYHPDWIDEGIEQHLEMYRALLEYYADGGEPPGLVEGNAFAAARVLVEGG